LQGTQRTGPAFGSTVRREAVAKNMLGIMKEPDEAAHLKAAIDDNLRKIYNALLKEDVPDRFKDLLEQLRKKESGR
jgi:hypothetical protein